MSTRRKEITQVLYWIITFDIDALCDYLDTERIKVRGNVRNSICCVFRNSIRLALWKDKKKRELEVFKNE